MYDYQKSKETVEKILKSSTKIEERSTIPLSDSEFTYENGIKAWVGALFIDIVDSSKLFKSLNENTARIIRSFCSEIISILKDDPNYREIGIRGDCVYAIYTSPNKNDEYELADKTFYINTYMRMLNELLKKRSLPQIKVGIGMSTAQELVVKAGRKDVEINNKVWIGKTFTKASNLLSIGNKNGNSPLVYSESSYNNFINLLVEKDKTKDPKSWFTYHSDDKNGGYYTANIVKIGFDTWISNGMKD